MRWTKGELEVLWSTENPGNGNPTLMAAIALAESGGDDQVVNSIGACGLWQIHPYQGGCQSPYTNARQAGQKLRTQGLGAWETYTNGSYKQFLGGGKANTTYHLPGPLGLEIPIPSEDPFAGPQLPGTGNNPLTEGFSSLGGIADAFGKIGKLIQLLSSREGWLRIGKVVVGLFLLLTGVIGMANIQPVQSAKHGATKAAEVAAVVK